MRTLRRTTGAVLGTTTALAAMMLGGLQGSASAATPADQATAAATATNRAAQADWKLVPITGGESQSVCGSATVDRVPRVYIVIQGSWSTEIEVGVSDLPAGVTYNDLGPVPPGSNPSGTRVTGLLSVNVPKAPAGTTHKATLWASDGSQRQTVPLYIEWKESC
ncbi:DUF5980 family protein [Streptomyces sp. enrichment culture]|uniref:DUF5980 family protein n=1 Tax=Streptomyces sp. enrichment culture TaxID=1795815 RepID=UPI003F569C96